MDEADLNAVRDAMLQERRESVHGRLSYELECQLRARIIKTDQPATSPAAVLENFFEVVVSELADLRVEVAGLRLELESYRAISGGVPARRLPPGPPKVSISSRLRPEPTQYRLTFDQRLPVSGWYEVEYMTDGTVFRWLGPRPSSTFDIVVSRRTPLEARVVVTQAVTPELMERVRLLVDAVPVPSTHKMTAQGYHQITAILPAGAGPHPVPHLSLTIETDRCLAPRDLFPDSVDPRQISVAVSEISVVSLSAAKPEERPATDAGALAPEGDAGPAPGEEPEPAPLVTASAAQPPLSEPEPATATGSRAAAATASRRRAKRRS